VPPQDLNHDLATNDTFGSFSELLSHLSPAPTSSGFDSQHPPDPTLIDACVHCGFCLATCPSYRVIGAETDSPRGRIYQMDAINEGSIGLSPATVSHFDSCLGCLACVTACPSGVQYDQLIEATRAQVQRNHPRSLWETLLRQAIYRLFPYPRRLRPLLGGAWLYQKLGLDRLMQSSGLLTHLAPPLAAMTELLPPLTRQDLQPDHYPSLIPAQGERRYRVGLVLGCVQRIFAPQINWATIEVLTGNGCEVVIPPAQGCCGALSHHQGETQQAQALAKDLMQQFQQHAQSEGSLPLDAIVTNASGCGHTLKSYGSLLAEDPSCAAAATSFATSVKDVQEFLAEVGLTATLHPLRREPLPLVYQDACHQLHGQKIQAQPRQLLNQIPGVSLRDPIDAALCCGSAGIYNLLQPEVANELGQQKVTRLLDTQAEAIVSANIGCRMQLLKHLRRQGQDQIPVFHPMELLQMSMQGKTIPLS